MEAPNSAQSDKKSEHVLDLLSPFVDGETNMDETRHIERHIAACSLCSGQLAFLRATTRTLRHASDALPSPALFERIARATYEKPSLSERVSLFLRPAPVRMALGGVLAAGLFAAVIVPRLTTLSPVRSTGNGESAKPDLASVPSPAKTGKTPAAPSDATPKANPPAVAFNTKNGPQVKPFALSPQTASLGVSLARNIGRYLPSSAAPTASISKPSVKPVAPRSVVDERDKFVVSITRPAPRANRSVQASSTTPIVKHSEPTVFANVVPAANRLLRSQAAKLMTRSNTNIVATILHSELPSRSNPSRLERPTLPKVETNGAVAAVVAPEPVKPISKPEETALPNPVVDAPRTVGRKNGFSLAGAGTGTKNGGLSLVSARETFSTTGRTPFVSIVDAPMGSK